MIRYIINKGFDVNNSNFYWGQLREDVRKAIAEAYSINDISLAQEDGKPLIYKRDDYFSINNQEALLFLSYNSNDEFNEFELHKYPLFYFENVNLSFETNFNSIIRDVSKLSNKIFEISFENILFPDLCLNISSNRAMGGETENLGYIYIAKDISHLLNV